jgi:hypothetical protein
MLVWYCGTASLTAALAVLAFVILVRVNLVRWWLALAARLTVSSGSVVPDFSRSSRRILGDFSAHPTVPHREH